MVCPNCGNNINDVAKFCPFCGSNVAQENKKASKRVSPSAPTSTHLKKSKKPLILLSILLALVAGGVVGGIYLFANGNDPASGPDAYEVSLANYTEVNDSITDLAQSEEYTELSTEEKVDTMLELLRELEDAEEILANSVSYDGEHRIITYDYADGACGVIIPEDTSQEATTTPKYIYSDAFPLLTELQTETSPYEEKNLQALIVCNLDDPETDEQVLEEQTQWSASYLQTAYNKNCTVDSLRTGLSGYDLICFRITGILRDDTPVLCLYEAFSDDPSTIADLQDGLISVVWSNGEFRVGLLPEFFAHYYGDEGLAGAIVYLGGSLGQQNDSLVETMTNCGAKAVVGYTGEVTSAYDIAMNEAFVYGLLCGKTVGNSLDVAQSIGDNTDFDFAREHLDSSDDTPTELHCYNGSDETLATLTTEAQARLEAADQAQNTKSAIKAEILEYFATPYADFIAQGYETIQYVQTMEDVYITDDLRMIFQTSSSQGSSASVSSDQTPYWAIGNISSILAIEDRTYTTDELVEFIKTDPDVVSVEAEYTESPNTAYYTFGGSYFKVTITYSDGDYYVAEIQPASSGSVNPSDIIGLKAFSTQKETADTSDATSEETAEIKTYYEGDSVTLTGTLAVETRDYKGLTDYFYILKLDTPINAQVSGYRDKYVSTMHGNITSCYIGSDTNTYASLVGKHVTVTGTLDGGEKATADYDENGDVRYAAICWITNNSIAEIG